MSVKQLDEDTEFTSLQLTLTNFKPVSVTCVNAGLTVTQVQWINGEEVPENITFLYTICSSVK